MKIYVASCWRNTIQPRVVGRDIIASLRGVETHFGDFSEGRFMWGTANPRRFDKPIPARGALGLWDWEVPEGVKI